MKTTRILNLNAAPKDPIERLMWLTGVQDAVKAELDREYGATYYEARLQGRLDAAIEAGPYGRKTAIAYTRHENRRRGQTVRWGDGADPYSSAKR